MFIDGLLFLLKYNKKIIIENNYIDCCLKIIGVDIIEINDIDKNNLYNIGFTWSEEELCFLYYHDSYLD